MTSLARRLLLLLVPAALAAGLLVAPPADAAKPECRRTLPAYPILRPGDHGRAVRTLQCSLNDVGVGPIVVDGSYGPQTKAAVRKIVDGFEGEPARPYRINNGFWTLLFGGQLPDHQLVKGDHGHAVRLLQRALRAAGGKLVVDGRFGPQTEAVVKQYQKAQAIAQTGRVERRTRFMLAMGGVIGGLN